MSVWKNPQPSQTDSKWQSSSFGSGAPAVAEHPAILETKPSHGRCFLVVVGIGVEGVDLVGDHLELVGNDPVGDAGVGHGHPQVPMAEQLGDGFEAHAPVDGLGGQGVAQLVGTDVSDTGFASDPTHQTSDGVVGPKRLRRR
jgi:hypothetical protein